MPIEVFMPQFGESVDEAYIVRWMKSKGDVINEHEPLLEVNTDKIDVEVPSPATGILSEILVAAGKTVPAGTLLAIIKNNQEHETIVSPSNIEPGQRRESSGPGARGFISPVVAKLAAEHQIDLHQVTGTGMAGRITKQDIFSYLDTRKQAVESAQEVDGLVQDSSGGIKLNDEIVSEFKFLPLSPIRRMIAERMVTSKQTSPHVTTVMEADLSRVIAHRSRTEPRPTFTAYFVAATARALKAFPLVNSSWSEGHDNKPTGISERPSTSAGNDSQLPAGIILHQSVNIGIAVSLGETGLVVPVIRDADMLSLSGLTKVIADLSSRARSGLLKPEEVKGGTFTITNHGVNGSLFAFPIINQPQCGILGVGAVQKRVVVAKLPDDSDTVAIRPMVYLTFTFDHRILDGAIADHFLAKIVSELQFKDGLEN